MTQVGGQEAASSHAQDAAAAHNTEAVASIASALAGQGFAFASGAVTRSLLDDRVIQDWESFAASWDHLGLDRYMADGGRYRRRRFATLAVSDGRVRRKPPQPHYQSRDYNPLNGGVTRWFDPVTDAIATHPVTLAAIRACDRLFTGLTAPESRPRSWHVEMHQFRIEAAADGVGKPTPEGLHRDGVDWVMVLLVQRRNAASGETRIADLARRPLGHFVLGQPLDAAFTDDSRVYHGVTPIHPLDPARPATRDVLVLTFRRE